MKNLLDSFKDKKFKHGGYAALLVGVVLAMLVAANLLVDLIPFKADLTKEKLYSLSDQTRNILDNLEQEVMVYGLYEAGKQNPLYDEIMRRYETRTKRLTIKYIDPYRNPTFAKKYELEGKEPGANSLIIESGTKFKVISQFDLINYRQTDPNNPFARQASSLKVEQVVTSAIMSVTSETDPTIYLLEGHREEGLPSELKSALTTENYIIKDLNLLTSAKVPEDANILLIISPKQDITAADEAKIREFLFERRGNVIIMRDLIIEEFPNLDKILKSYGVAINPVLVHEEDPQRHYPQIPIGLVPDMTHHAITSAMKSSDVGIFFPFSQTITELEIKKRTIEVEALLQTSEKAWAKVNLKSQTATKTAEDIEGPFQLAVAVTDKGEGEGQADSRAVIIASSFFLYPEKAGFPLQGTGNADFLPGCLNWLRGQEELISIRPKSLLSRSLSLNQLQFFLFAGISVILIPLLILGSGLVIWLKRRHL